MTAALADLARLFGLAALLLSFAILAGRRIQAPAYLLQVAAVAAAAFCQAAPQGDWTLAALPPILAAQAALVWINRPELPARASFPVVTLCASLLLVVLATAAAPMDGLAAPLAIALLGLLGAAAMPGPYGVLSLLNGVALAMTVAPSLPLRPLLTLALGGLALMLVRDGGRIAWMRR